MSTERIEEMVCLCTNEALREISPDYDKEVTTDMLYAGVTRAPMCVLVARQMCYLVMHDMYGMSYGVISKRAGISRRRIMSGILKARSLSFTDGVYRGVRERICKRLKVNY